MFLSLDWLPQFLKMYHFKFDRRKSLQTSARFWADAFCIELHKVSYINKWRHTREVKYQVSWNPGTSKTLEYIGERSQIPILIRIRTFKVWEKAPHWSNIKHDSNKPCFLAARLSIHDSTENIFIVNFVWSSSEVFIS